MADLVFPHLPARLRALLLERGWSYADLASRAGLGAGMVREVCAGRAEPRLAWLGKVAGALGVEVEDLIRDRPPRRLPPPLKRGRPPAPRVEAPPQEPKKRGRPRKTPPQNNSPGNANQG